MIKQKFECTLKVGNRTLVRSGLLSVSDKSEESASDNSLRIMKVYVRFKYPKYIKSLAA